jgi:integrase
MGRRRGVWYRAERDAWFTTWAGRQVRLAVGKDSRKAAVRRWHEMELASSRTGRLEAGVLSVADVANLRVAWLRRHRAPSTARNDEWFLSWAGGALGQYPAAELEPYQVEAWLSRRETWSAQTRRNAAVCLKAALGWAVKAGHILGHKLARLELPSPRRRRHHVTVARFAEVEPYIRSEPFRLFCRLMLATGARPSELMRLEAAHLDHGRMVGTLPGKTTRMTGRQIVVRFPAMVWPPMAQLAQEHPRGPLLRMGCGRPWTRSNLNNQIRAVRRRARREGVDLGWLTLYGMRHGFATEHLARGVPLPVVSALLNHASSDTTARVYDHVRHEDEALRRALDGTSGPGGSSEASSDGRSRRVADTGGGRGSRGSRKGRRTRLGV